MLFYFVQSNIDAYKIGYCNANDIINFNAYKKILMINVDSNKFFINVHSVFCEKFEIIKSNEELFRGNINEMKKTITHLYLEEIN